MQEIAKSRSSTPQCENVKTSVTETLQLLQKWSLLELQNKFKEHEITLRSLIYLTEEEICELAPKIGTRTIFRALLKEWRKTCDLIEYPRTSSSSTCEMDNDSYLDHIELKEEYSSDGIDTSTNYLDADCFKLNQETESKLNKNKNNNDSQNVSELSKVGELRNQFNYEGKPFVVLDILNSSPDGRTVLEFYKIHKILDMKNRKRIVNLLIRNVVERKVAKYTAIFHDMTHQLLQLFPTEKYETYFVPHNGPNSARGALYYRYSNYTRQLRKEGLLAYKKHKPKNNNKKL